MPTLTQTSVPFDDVDSHDEEGEDEYNDDEQDGSACSTCTTSKMEQDDGMTRHSSTKSDVKIPVNHNDGATTKTKTPNAFSTKLTLSLGGVDFSLVPTVDWQTSGLNGTTCDTGSSVNVNSNNGSNSNDRDTAHSGPGGSVTLHQMATNQMVLNLCSFTGQLVVHIPPQQDQQPQQLVQVSSTPTTTTDVHSDTTATAHTTTTNNNNNNNNNSSQVIQPNSHEEAGQEQPNDEDGLSVKHRRIVENEPITPDRTPKRTNPKRASSRTTTNKAAVASPESISEASGLRQQKLCFATAFATIKPKKAASRNQKIKLCKLKLVFQNDINQTEKFDYTMDLDDETIAASLPQKRKSHQKQYQEQSQHSKKHRNLQPMPTLGQPDFTDEEHDRNNNDASRRRLEDGHHSPSFSQTLSLSSAPSSIVDHPSSSSNNPIRSVQDILQSIEPSVTAASTISSSLESSTQLPFSACSVIIEKDDDLIMRHEQDDDVSVIDDAGPPPSIVESAQPPCPRWGHSATVVQDGKVLVYGGQAYESADDDVDNEEQDSVILSDVHLYDPKTQTWNTPIMTSGDSRQFHTATYLPQRQLMLCFGGESLQFDKKKKTKVATTDSLRVLDTELMLWFPPAVSGDIPSARSGHSATLLPNTNEMVIFGGSKGSSKWLFTVSVLDTQKWIWSSISPKGSPPKARSYHSATAVLAYPGMAPTSNDNPAHKIVIFGGNNKNMSFNTVHVLEPPQVTGDSNWKWSHPTVKGKAPFPRTDHSATLLEDGTTICIYGGWDPNAEDDDDSDDGNSGSAPANERNIFKGSYLLDTRTWTWTTGPKPVFAGANGKIAASGDVEQMVKNCGPKRCGHSTFWNPTTSEIVAFGGQIPGNCLANDMQVLSFASQSKSRATS